MPSLLHCSENIWKSSSFASGIFVVAYFCSFIILFPFYLNVPTIIQQFTLFVNDVNSETLLIELRI